MKKILSLHIFAALACLAVASVASAQCDGCNAGPIAAPSHGVGGGLLGKMMAASHSGCNSCAQARPAMGPSLLQNRGGCAGNGLCSGRCGGGCGGRLVEALTGNGFVGLLSGGHAHSEVGGACMTCNNVWDGYCSERERCLPHAHYPLQNYHGRCGTCGGKGCGLCAKKAGCSTCGAAPCSCASAPQMLAPAPGCDGGCNGCAGAPIVRALPIGAPLVAIPAPVAAPAAGVGPAAVTPPAAVNYNYATAPQPTPAQPTPAITPAEVDPEPTQAPVEAHSPVDGSGVDAISAEPVKNPIPPIPPSPVAEPELDNQTRTGAFDWLNRALRMN